MIDDIQSLAAGIALAAKIVLIPTNLNDVVVFDSNLEPTEISSKHTCCLFPIHCHTSL
ncbi:MAG: hypothetical protein SV686_16795 [Thermodesulfobacteriota bacterium]|nr:hypothetical protein [Thermodesulfobacteriota bacterium]